MFTGLIQTLGSIKIAGTDEFQINPQKSLADLAIGDSIAVDGVCLTVEEISGLSFLATASPETLKRTTLEHNTQLAKYVNLETSLRAGGKIGGHFVTGHVDGKGCLTDAVKTERAWELTFAPSPSLTEQWTNFIAPYLVSKGSVAVNGISLTVAQCEATGNWFKVSVIPLTYAETNLSHLKIGDLVNIEADILGKYVERLLKIKPQKEAEDISLAFLGEHGYI